MTFINGRHDLSHQPRREEIRAAVSDQQNGKGACRHQDSSPQRRKRTPDGKAESDDIVQHRQYKAGDNDAAPRTAKPKENGQTPELVGAKNSVAGGRELGAIGRDSNAGIALLKSAGVVKPVANHHDFSAQLPELLNIAAFVHGSLPEEQRDIAPQQLLKPAAFQRRVPGKNGQTKPAREPAGQVVEPITEMAGKMKSAEQVAITGNKEPWSGFGGRHERRRDGADQGVTRSRARRSTSDARQYGLRSHNRVFL